MPTMYRHNEEIRRNLKSWQDKPLLRRLYRSFHEAIAQQLPDRPAACVVELGSGVADVSEVIPGCIRTDFFPNPWIARVENAYSLSFADASVSALILFDVFHHLRYPGTALQECHRVLVPGGRVVLFEPCMSLLGLLVYGLLHEEPLGLRQPIQWHAPEGWSHTDLDDYAAQGNATRVFLRGEIDVTALGWRVVATRRLSAISYVASGGYSKPQMYPDRAIPLMRLIDKVCDLLPSVFATRVMVVLEKPTGAASCTPADADQPQREPPRRGRRG